MQPSPLDDARPATTTGRPGRLVRLRRAAARAAADARPAAEPRHPRPTRRSARCPRSRSRPPPRRPPAPPPVEPEVIWGTGRSTEQILALVREARREHPDRPALVLRASAETLVALAAEHDAYTTMDAAALAAAVGPLPEPAGRVRVLSAGGADAAVAAEAAFVARVSGTEVVRVDDLGGSRLRALLADGVAARRRRLPGRRRRRSTPRWPRTIATLTDVPVVAVPTSTGQPSAFGGLGALLTMLNSTAPGRGRQQRSTTATRPASSPPGSPAGAPAEFPARSAISHALSVHDVRDRRSRRLRHDRRVTIGWLDLARGRLAATCCSARWSTPGCRWRCLPAAIDALPVEPIRLETEPVTRHGLGATRVHVHAPTSSHHRTWARRPRAAHRRRARARPSGTARWRCSSGSRSPRAGCTASPPTRCTSTRSGALDALADVVGVVAGFDAPRAGPG